MSYIDIVIVLLLIISIILGWRQGFIRQLFGLLALLLGVYCAFEFSHFAAHYIAKWFKVSEPVTNSVAFAVTFIVVLVCVILVGRFADKIITMVAFGWLNRLLGTLLSLVKFGLIISVSLFVLNMFHVPPSEHTHKSKLYWPMEQAGKTVFPYLKRLAQTTFQG